MDNISKLVYGSLFNIWSYFYIAMVPVLIVILLTPCYATRSQLRIYGGVDAKSYEFLYVVRLELQSFYNFTNNTAMVYQDHMCTASALSSVWLITAAHCLTITKLGMVPIGPPFFTAKIVVRYGHVENSPWEKDSFSNVLYTVIHPLFMTNRFGVSGLTMRNDIGLLKVSPIYMKNYIKLSAVDYQTLYGYEATIAGFGYTTNTNSEGKIETNSTLHLLKPLQLLKTLVSKCSGGESLVPALCLASKCNIVNNACPGDSGGPIIHTSGLIGVVSAGKATGYCSMPITKKRVDTAALITPVSPYIEWIYSYITDAKPMD